MRVWGGGRGGGVVVLEVVFGQFGVGVAVRTEKSVSILFDGEF